MPPLSKRANNVHDSASHGVQEGQISLVQREEEETFPSAGAPAAESPCAQPQHQPAVAAPAATAASGAGATVGPDGAVGGQPPASPGRNLHIDEEQFWPSLSTAAQPGSNKGSTAATSRHTSPRDTPSPPPIATKPAGSGKAPWPKAGPGVATQPQQGEQQVQGSRERSSAAGPAAERDALGNEGSSASSSSAATTATTPQSPVSSVVAYRARIGGSLSQNPPVAGTCHVSLAPSALVTPPLDEEGASLVASLQGAVKAGSLSLKQAAASLVSYLQQKHAQQVAAVTAAAAAGRLAGAPGSLQWQQPLLSLQQLSLGGASGAQIRSGGEGGLAAEAGRLLGGPSLLFPGAPSPLLANPGRRVPLDSSPSIAVSEALTFAHWGRSDSLASALSPMSSAPGAGLFEGWASPRHSAQQHLHAPQPSPQHQQQQQQPQLCRVPLYARGAASAGSAGPGLAAMPAAGMDGPRAQVGSSGFPGFQSSQQQQASPEQRRPAGAAAGLMSPPGFSRRAMHNQQQQGLQL
ncbi:hypothetical protein N2152v2_008800 [Parachlorella kessleri]